MTAPQWRVLIGLLTALILFVAGSQFWQHRAAAELADLRSRRLAAQRAQDATLLEQQRLLPLLERAVALQARAIPEPDLYHEFARLVQGAEAAASGARILAAAFGHPAAPVGGLLRQQLTLNAQVAGLPQLIALLQHLEEGRGRCRVDTFGLGPAAGAANLSLAYACFLR